MKIEEAIEWMEETIQDINELFDQCSTALQEEITEQKEVFELALTALRSMQEVGEPLSLEQLKQMDGKPVWIERIEAPYDGKWFIVNYADTENPDKTLYTDSGVTYSEYGKYFIAYPYPPAHIDRSKWISVKERLPKDFDQALVYDGDEHYPIGICHKGESGIWHSDMAYGMGTITHWMPLPKPPEED